MPVDYDIQNLKTGKVAQRVQAWMADITYCRQASTHTHNHRSSVRAAGTRLPLYVSIPVSNMVMLNGESMLTRRRS